MKRILPAVVLGLLGAAVSFGTAIGPNQGSIRSVGFGGGAVGQSGGENPMFGSRTIMVSGVSYLPQSITVNGTTVAAKLWYEAKDISGTDWTGTGPDLTEVSTGDSPVSGRRAPFTDDTEAVSYSGAKFHQSSTSVAADDITTGDFCAEGITKTAPSSSINGVVGTRGASGAGWVTRYNGTRLEFDMDDGTTAVNVHGTFQYTGAYHYWLACGNRDEASTNGFKWLINAEVKGSADISAMSDSLASANDLTVGARGDDTWPATVEVAFFALYEQSDLFSAGSTGADEMQELATERFNTLTGLKPQYAMGDPVPNTQSRGTEKHCQIYNGTSTKLFEVGNHWMCVDLRGATWPVSSGTGCPGLSLEVATTNLLTYNEEYDQWTVNNGAVDTDVAEAPNLETVADAIVGNGSDTTHYVTNAPTLTAATYAISTYAKAGDQDFVVVSDDTLGDGSYFDLTDCSTGADFGSAPNAKFAEDLGDGWCRVGITVTGTAAAHTIGLYAATADGDNTFAGDSSTANVYLWGAQAEATNYMTSPISTTVANNARSGDDIKFDSTGNMFTDGSGAFKGTVICANHDTDNSEYLFSVNDGTINERMHIHINSADVPYSFGVDSSSTEWGIAGTSDPSDGSSHIIRSTFETNSINLYFDGVSEGTPDTVATVPTAFTQISLGHLLTAAGTDLPSNCIIENYSIWDSVGGGA